MRAFVAGDDGATLTQLGIPTPAAGAVQVRIHASALNRIDLKMATGYRHGQSGGAGAVLGIEWTGEVIAVDDSVSGCRVGDRVAGMGAGGFADVVVAREAQLFALPPAMTYEQAVCFPVGLRTMHEAITASGAFQPGQSVLVQGASSAVGLIGMQVARALGAAIVIGTSTTAERVARLGDYGADLALDSTADDWVDRVLAATDGKGVDLVIDQVSGALLNRTLRATRVLGRIVNVGRLGGTMQPFDAELHAMRRISLIGTTFSSRSADEYVAVSANMLRDLYAPLAAGAFDVPIAARFDFLDLPAAMEDMRTNRHMGKVVLRHG